LGTPAGSVFRTCDVRGRTLLAIFLCGRGCAAACLRSDDVFMSVHIVAPAQASRATLALRIVRCNGGRRLRCNGAAFPQLGFGQTIGRTDGPPTPYVGSQNVDFNIICRSNGFRATARSCLSCWKILVPIAAVRGASTLAFTGGDAFGILPASSARNCAGADTFSFVRTGCRS
jgi:hypothetical protein